MQSHDQCHQSQEESAAGVAERKLDQFCAKSGHIGADVGRGFGDQGGGGETGHGVDCAKGIGTGIDDGGGNLRHRRHIGGKFDDDRYGEWLKRGYVPAYGRKLSAAELAETASLLQPAGLYGPSFLATKNYFVIKEYNFSDLYVLFVGHLSDRMLDPRPFETPWSKVAQLPTVDLDKMQRILTDRGFYHDKIDGKAGMLTRAALGAYQKANRLKLDCWPTAALLSQMQAAGRN